MSKSDYLQAGHNSNGGENEERINSRVPWSCGLSQEDKRREGAQLLAMLLRVSNDRGLTLKEMVEELGVSYGYFSQLRSGARKVKHVSDEVADKMAEFLRVPRITVLIAAGRVRAEDYCTHPENSGREVDASLQYIQKDPRWGSLLPPEADDACAELKRFIVMAYEEATGKVLISSEAYPITSMAKFLDGEDDHTHESRG